MLGQIFSSQGELRDCLQHAYRAGLRVCGFIVQVPKGLKIYLM